jgi:DNA polymerase-3 subunit delta
MLIKQAALAAHLQKALSPIYILIGSDHYLLNTAADSIKTSWQTRQESEKKFITLNQASDWTELLEEAYAYSLFSHAQIIDATYDKKTLDAAGKHTLKTYAQNINSQCLLIIRAPELFAKQLQPLSSHPSITIVQIISLNPESMHLWIGNALQQAQFKYSPEIPILIQQHTAGNHLASAQVIEKLKLMHQPGHIITQEDVIVHLSDQCDYQLYELTDACLNGNINQAIHIVRNLSENRTEITLVLWLLTQEIRLLIQLKTQLTQGIPITSATNSLKIWPNKLKLYQASLQRLTETILFKLLRMSQQLDEAIKTSVHQRHWLELERIILKMTETQGSAV